MRHHRVPNMTPAFVYALKSTYDAGQGGRGVTGTAVINAGGEER